MYGAEASILNSRVAAVLHECEQACLRSRQCVGCMLSRPCDRRTRFTKRRPCPSRARLPPVLTGVAVWLLDPWARSSSVPSRRDFRFLGLRQRIWVAFAYSMNFSVRRCPAAPAVVGLHPARRGSRAAHSQRGLGHKRCTPWVGASHRPVQPGCLLLGAVPSHFCSLPSFLSAPGLPTS